MSFTVTEPHPTVPANAYTYSGRGGLGNTFRAPATTPAEGVPTTLTRIGSASSSSPATGTVRYYAGRGGAGNAHPVSQRRELSLDDEYVYATAVAGAATSGHVGRGGAGNVFSSKSLSAHFQKPKKSNRRKESDASTSTSGSSDGNIRSGFWSRFRS
ncbi:hypothetical protein CMQ_603 [Grosmannia clavigera kw1407]|uniref:Uncharacterized protein n=1 Tax=Grosmannia clavigera (strain kw1407 / UAMH 11150) TaxID=655863 RepID=F0XFP5_GROCL|nr:uncharacterized protein CMQ_603 [Grosmannia clavigera kw1407]EFX03675.1 hypothetical protein CMQ_603 [Grosmannia clavigera kw1407]